MAKPKVFAELAWRAFRPGIGGKNGKNGQREPQETAVR